MGLGKEVSSGQDVLQVGVLWGRAGAVGCLARVAHKHTQLKAALCSHKQKEQHGFAPRWRWRCLSFSSHRR